MTGPSSDWVDWIIALRHARLLDEYRSARQIQQFLDEDEYQRGLVADAAARLAAFEERHGLPATEVGAA